MKDHYSHIIGKARSEALEAVGTPYTARFYERMLAELFGHEVDIKHIMTGVTTFTGEFYHDLGF